ncbi:MAG: hypothetical protein II699_00710 [Lachnospiraceae bacterium]|nr:hypothetical protein [Lachnospiraceae bacterium]
MREVTIDEKYRVIIDGTSDGTQDKYFKDGIWYKTDRYGGEGHNEALVSKLLSCTNIDNYVEYEEVIINGHKGCCSSNFLNKNEEYVSIYRLHANSVGGDIAKKLMYMDYDDQVDYVRNFVKNETGLNVDEAFLWTTATVRQQLRRIPSTTGTAPKKSAARCISARLGVIRVRTPSLQRAHRIRRRS